MTVKIQIPRARDSRLTHLAKGFPRFVRPGILPSRPRSGYEIPSGANARAKFFVGMENFLQFARACSNLAAMTQPLALLLCATLRVGSQLAARLQDMEYRVQSVPDSDSLATTAEREKALLIIAEIATDGGKACAAIASLRANPITAHIPVIAFTAEGREPLQAAARDAGATLVVTDTALATHLNHLLDQALALD